MNAGWISSRTRLLALASVLSVAAVYAASLFVNEEYVTAVSDLGELAIVALAAYVVLRSALALTPGEPLRRRWIMIGAGVVLFAIGDAIWSYIDILGQDPFPSLADPFYLAVYPLIAAGLFSTALAFRAFVDVRKLLLATGAVTAALAAMLYSGFLNEVLLDTESNLLEKLISAFYPIGDLLLLFAPALFAALALRSMGRGRLAVPLWSVVGGVALLAVTDAAFSWMDWLGTYESGSVIDVGWMLGYLLIALGASLTRDLAQPGS